MAISRANSNLEREESVLLLGLSLLLLALVILTLVALKKKAMGLPHGKLHIADSQKWSRCERELFSSRYRLVGRPDYLFQEKGQFIPVEIKSGRSPHSPHASHVFQLIAYCLLVEESTGFVPPYGIIAYRDGHFRVNYTPALKAELLKIVDEMRKTLTIGQEPEAKESPKCFRCGYRPICFKRA